MAEPFTQCWSASILRSDTVVACHKVELLDASLYQRPDFRVAVITSADNAGVRDLHVVYESPDQAQAEEAYTLLRGALSWL